MSAPSAGLGKDALAALVARDIPAGAFVNLGIGLPTQVRTTCPPAAGSCSTPRTACSGWDRRPTATTSIPTW